MPRRGSRASQGTGAQGVEGVLGSSFLSGVRREQCSAVQCSQPESSWGGAEQDGKKHALTTGPTLLQYSTNLPPSTCSIESRLASYAQHQPPPHDNVRRRPSNIFYYFATDLKIFRVVIIHLPRSYYSSLCAVRLLSSTSPGIYSAARTYQVD
ncbi:hypothetical protein VTL71DRAFT_8704 [Oculimacula yallundae]|uniref:Uncharacterized protein n=1 Tax=Oculimacula yallundae TaxID=86028 RepID=A0ABR4CYD7_9HELO